MVSPGATAVEANRSPSAGTAPADSAWPPQAFEFVYEGLKHSRDKSCRCPGSASRQDISVWCDVGLDGSSGDRRSRYHVSDSTGDLARSVRDAVANCIRHGKPPSGQAGACVHEIDPTLYLLGDDDFRRIINTVLEFAEKHRGHEGAESSRKRGRVCRSSCACCSSLTDEQAAASSNPIPPVTSRIAEPATTISVPQPCFVGVPLPTQEAQGDEYGQAPEMTTTTLISRQSVTKITWVHFDSSRGRLPYTDADDSDADYLSCRTPTPSSSLVCQPTSNYQTPSEFRSRELSRCRHSIHISFTAFMLRQPPRNWFVGDPVRPRSAPPLRRSSNIDDATPSTNSRSSEAARCYGHYSDYGHGHDHGHTTYTSVPRRSSSAGATPIISFPALLLRRCVDDRLIPPAQLTTPDEAEPQEPQQQLASAETMYNLGVDAHQGSSKSTSPDGPTTPSSSPVAEEDDGEKSTWAHYRHVSMTATIPIQASSNLENQHHNHPMVQREIRDHQRQKNWTQGQTTERRKSVRQRSFIKPRTGSLIGTSGHQRRRDSCHPGRARNSVSVREPPPPMAASQTTGTVMAAIRRRSRQISPALVPFLGGSTEDDEDDACPPQPTININHQQRNPSVSIASRRMRAILSRLPAVPQPDRAGIYSAMTGASPQLPVAGDSGVSAAPYLDTAASIQTNQDSSLLSASASAGEVADPHAFDWVGFGYFDPRRARARASAAATADACSEDGRPHVCMASSPLSGAETMSSM